MTNAIVEESSITVGICVEREEAGPAAKEAVAWVQRGDGDGCPVALPPECERVILEVIGSKGCHRAIFHKEGIKGSPYFHMNVAVLNDHCPGFICAGNRAKHADVVKFGIYIGLRLPPLDDSWVLKMVVNPSDKWLKSKTNLCSYLPTTFDSTYLLCSSTSLSRNKEPHRGKVFRK